MTTERVLRRWRREALEALQQEHSLTTDNPKSENIGSLQCKVQNERILVLTQTLLDQYLIRKGR